MGTPHSLTNFSNPNLTQRARSLAQRSQRREKDFTRGRGSAEEESVYAALCARCAAIMHLARRLRGFSGRGLSRRIREIRGNPTTACFLSAYSAYSAVSPVLRLRLAALRLPLRPLRYHWPGLCRVAGPARACASLQQAAFLQRRLERFTVAGGHGHERQAVFLFDLPQHGQGGF